MNTNSEMQTRTANLEAIHLLDIPKTVETVGPRTRRISTPLKRGVNERGHKLRFA
jgi:hypothetical protein